MLSRTSSIAVEVVPSCQRNVFRSAPSTGPSATGLVSAEVPADAKTDKLRAVREHGRLRAELLEPPQHAVAGADLDPRIEPHLGSDVIGERNSGREPVDGRVLTVTSDPFSMRS